MNTDFFLNHIINQNVLNRNVRPNVGDIKFQQMLPKRLMRWCVESVSSCPRSSFTISGPSCHHFFASTPWSTTSEIISTNTFNFLPPGLPDLSQFTTSTFSVPLGLLSTDPENHSPTPAGLGHIPRVNVTWPLNSKRKLSHLTLEGSHSHQPPTSARSSRDSAVWLRPFKTLSCETYKAWLTCTQIAYSWLVTVYLGLPVIFKFLTAVCASRNI